MRAIEIIALAFKAEAKAKPSEFVIIGTEKHTYTEFAEMIEKYPRKNSDYVKTLIPVLEKMFRENPAFQRKMMSLAGVYTWNP